MRYSLTLGTSVEYSAIRPECLGTEFPKLLQEFSADARATASGEGYRAVLTEAGLTAMIAALEQAGYTNIEHLLAQNAFGKPSPRLLAREIDHAAIELAKVDMVNVVVVQVQAEMTARARFFIKIAVHRDVRVGIGQKADAARVKVSDPRRKAGIAIRTACAAVPIPEQPPPDDLRYRLAGKPGQKRAVQAGFGAHGQGFGQMQG